MANVYLGVWKREFSHISSHSILGRVYTMLFPALFKDIQGSHNMYTWLSIPEFGDFVAIVSVRNSDLQGSQLSIQSSVTEDITLVDAYGPS